MRVATASKLADQLGLTKGRISQLRKEKWFPLPGEDGSWDVEEVRRAVAKNINPRKAREKKADKKAAATASPAKSSRRSATTGDEDCTIDDALLRVLEDRGATAVEQSKAARQVAAQLFAQAARQNALGTKEQDGFKKALEEQRRTEAGFLDLEKKRGRLLPREVCASLCAQLARRCVQVLDNVESTLASQVEIWLGDDDFAELGSQDRQRTVRRWFHEHARGVREVEADFVEQLINQVAGELLEAAAEGVE